LLSTFPRLSAESRNIWSLAECHCNLETVDEEAMAVAKVDEEGKVAMASHRNLCN